MPRRNIPSFRLGCQPLLLADALRPFESTFVHAPFLSFHQASLAQTQSSNGKSGRRIGEWIDAYSTAHITLYINVKFVNF
jgi:hypothetical protein